MMESSGSEYVVNDWLKHIMSVDHVHCMGCKGHVTARKVRLRLCMFCTIWLHLMMCLPLSMNMQQCFAAIAQVLGIAKLNVA